MDDNPWGQTTPSPRPTPPIRAASPSPALSTSESAGPDWDATSNAEDAPVDVADVKRAEDEEGPVANELALEADVEENGADLVHGTAEKLEEVQLQDEPEAMEAEEAAESTSTDAEAQAATLPAESQPPPAILAPPEAINETQGPPMDDFPDDEELDAPSDPPTADDAFGADDDFDDFGEAGEAGDDDDFGDFGDFDEAGTSAFVDAESFDEPPPPPAPVPQRPPPPTTSTSYSGLPPLRFDLSDTSRQAVSDQLQDFLRGVYPNAEGSVSNEPERQVEGAAQVLVSEPLRGLLSNLSSMPQLRPLDWRRSRIRREHLIALGVPVNLDDSAESKPLASLVLPSVHGSPAVSSSASPHLGARTSSPRPSSPFGAQSPISRTPTPFADRERQRMGSQPPPLDRTRADALCAIPADDLTLMSLPKLKALRDEIDRTSEEASGALTHSLMMRDKETGDAETYNNMIQDLVTAAAKVTSTSARGGTAPARSGSGRWGRTIK